jgi:hypothetical protein
MIREEFAHCMAVLEAAYPRTAKLNRQQLDVWFDSLSDLTDDQLRHAVATAVRDGDDWPTISKLRRYSDSTGIDSKNRPLAAWQAVREAIPKVGAYMSPCFDDPVVNAVIRQLGGWPVVCETLTTEMKWLEKDFCKTYSALCNAKLGDDLTGRLHGLSEISNARKGYLDEPIHVAHVRCLTGNSNADKFITWIAESPSKPVSDTAKLENASAETLSLAMSLDESDQTSASDDASKQDANTPDPHKSKSQQIAELKCIANRSDDQPKAG